MGGDRQGVRRRPQVDESERNEERASEGGNKLLDFGRSIFNKGGKVVGGAVDEIKKIDVDEAARKAKELGKGAMDSDLGRQARELGKNIDAGDLARQAEKMARNVKPEDLKTVAGVAGTMAFPQLALIEKGSSELGNFVSRKMAKSLIGEPASLADKMVANYEIFDKDNSGSVTKAELSAKESIFGIADEKAALGVIMQSGFKTINGLDGNDSKDGLSSADIRNFKLLYDDAARSKYISGEASSTGLYSGLLGGAAGGGAAWYLAGMRSMGKVGAVVAGTAAIAGGVGYLVSRSRQNSFFEEKKSEVDEMLKVMRNAF